MGQRTVCVCVGGDGVCVGVGVCVGGGMVCGGGEGGQGGRGGGVIFLGVGDFFCSK